MIDLQHIHEGNEGMENLTQIAELENKIGYACQELREILKTYHYKSKEQHIGKDVVTSLENLLGSLIK